MPAPSVFRNRKLNSKGICVQKLRGGRPSGSVLLTKSLDFNGVDTQLVHTANALPAGELHYAFWIKYDTALTSYQTNWDSSDGLSTGTAWISGLKNPDGGGTDRRPGIFWGPPPQQGNATILQARGVWDLHVWTRDAANNWTIDTAVQRFAVPVAVANPVGLVEMAVGVQRGWTSALRLDGRIARFWLGSGAGSFATAAMCNDWRADPKIPTPAEATHHWNPGDTPGDTTALIQDTISNWNFAGTGGLTFQSDVP